MILLERRNSFTTNQVSEASNQCQDEAGRSTFLQNVSKLYHMRETHPTRYYSSQSILHANSNKITYSAVSITRGYGLDVRGRSQFESR
jgi:hypothetical protein